MSETNKDLLKAALQKAGIRGLESEVLDQVVGGIIQPCDECNSGCAVCCSSGTANR